MTSLSQQNTCSMKEVSTMETQLLITCVSHNSGALISVMESSLTKSRSVWLSSNSRVSLSKQRTKIVTKTLSHTWVSLDILRLPIGTILILTKAKSGIWCDYCKDRYGVHNPKGQIQASWTIKSELPQSKGRERHYCYACAREVQTWADGSIFTLQEQGEFLVKQMELI